ncbi:MAG: trypsin-like peptidase domain-containing protein, partial [Planctomycetia bacterium]
MRRSMPRLFTGICLAIAVVGRVGLCDDDLPFAEEQAIRAAVSRVASAVVRIETLATSEAGLAQGAEANPASGPSTGVVVADGGLVVTTSFCVPRDVDQAIVVLPPAGEEDAAGGAQEGGSRRRAARVVGRDVARGLVLLRMDQGRPEQTNPPAITEWVPRDELAVGRWTIAVGRGWNSPSPSVAVGILSAVNRSWGRSVQTDASVSPANYGGALVDIHGRVIGILAPLPADTAGMNLGTELSDSGIGFAGPYADLVASLPRLEKGETLVPG